MPTTRRHFVLLAAAATCSGIARAQQTLPLAGIAYLLVRVRDLDRSRAFYRSLGFEDTGTGIAGLVSLKINDHQYLRLLAQQSGAAPGFVAVGFETVDLDRAREEYAAHGLKPTEITRPPEGDPRFILDGPLRPVPISSPIPQLIEYIQYVPESHVSAGFGQHLGADRIADRLLAVSIPCADPEEAREFFLNDLDFKPLPGSPMLLHLSGNSGQYVALVDGARPGAEAAYLVLDTTMLGRAERHLHREHIAFSRAAANKEGAVEVFSFSDPDGNRIVVQQR